jgi:hypothetical protein
MANKKLSGKLRSIAEMNLAMHGSMDPDMEFLNSTEVENFKHWFDPANKLPFTGKMIVFGTGGEIDNGSFKNLWEDDK